MVDKGPGREKESSSEKAVIVIELEVTAFGIPEKLNLDEKQAVNESTTEDASIMQAVNESITTETQVANAEVVKEDCPVLQNQPKGTAVSHNVTELEGSKTGEGQEGTMPPQLSSSEKSGDITVAIEKQQNDEQIIDGLRGEVEQLKAVNSQLRYEAVQVSTGLGDAKMIVDRLKKVLKDENVAQECMSSAVVKRWSSILDCKFSNINKEMDAEIKYLVAKIKKQKQEIDSLSKNNDELLEKHEAENGKNARMEDMLKKCKERMIEEQADLCEVNCGKHEVAKLMEEQRSVMKGAAESMMASLSDKLQTLETAFEERCKLIQRQLSNCTGEIEMLRPSLRRRRMTDENDELTIKFLSTLITSVVLHKTNRTMKERLEEGAGLLERHLKSQPKLERLKKKVEAREKELAARTEETEVDIKHLTDAVGHNRERFDRLYENYHAREGHST